MSRHMRHSCPNDGCYLKGLPSWDRYIDRLPRGIRPTDVDGFMEIGGRFLFLEEKCPGDHLQEGQRIALRRLANFDGVTVAVFRPGTKSDLEVLIFDGSEPQGFQPYSYEEFESFWSAWATAADRCSA